MITLSKTSGQAFVNDNEDGVYTVILYDFTGSIQVDTSVVQLNIVLNGINIINSNIYLDPSVQSDISKLKISGKGSCTFRSLYARYVDIFADCKITELAGMYIHINACSVSLTSVTEIAITALDHIALVDSSLTIHSCDVGIDSLIVLVDNSNIHISGNNSAVDSEYNIGVRNGTVTKLTSTKFICEGSNLDIHGKPVELLRRELYAQKPAITADEFDMLKEHLGITHPDLHRRIESETTPPVDYEVFGRDYELGVYSLYSNRTTIKYYHDEDSLTCETP